MYLFGLCGCFSLVKTRFVDVNAGFDIFVLVCCFSINCLCKALRLYSDKAL